MATVPANWQTATLAIARAQPLVAQLRASVADIAGAFSEARERTVLISNGSGASVTQVELDAAIADAADAVANIKALRNGVAVLKILIDQVDAQAVAVDLL